MIFERFTKALLFSPILSGDEIGNWRAGQSYVFYEHDDRSGREIEVFEGDISNGADVPPAWLTFIISFLILWLFIGAREAIIGGLIIAALIAWLLPRIHAEYIAAVFIHDIGLKNFRHIFSRWEIDRLFLKAMRVERWPLQRRPPLKEFKRFYLWLVRVMLPWLMRIVRPYLMFAAVAFFGLIKERQNYFKKEI